MSKMTIMSKCGKNPWPIKYEGETNMYINNPGHMSKMTIMSKCGKNPSNIFFSRTDGLISMKLGMWHLVLEY